MRDDDGGPFQVIDTFNINATFPSDNQEQVFTGNKGIATITLTYDLTCIDPDACNAAVASSSIIGKDKAAFYDLCSQRPPPFYD